MGEVVLCGAGNGPGGLTLKTLLELRRCHVVFKRRVDWARLKRAVKAGRRAGVLLPGHPLLGAEGLALAERCRREKLRWRAVAAPSALGLAFTALTQRPELSSEWFEGFKVAQAAAAKPERRPQVVLGAGAAQARRLRRRGPAYAVRKGGRVRKAWAAAEALFIP